MLDSRLHQGDRTNDVDAGATDWVGLAKRHLEGSEVHEVRRLMLGKAGHHGGRVGDIERVAGQAGRIGTNEVA